VGVTTEPAKLAVLKTTLRALLNVYARKYRRIAIISPFPV